MADASGFGAFASLLGTAINASTGQQIQQGWQNLSQQQQQFLMDQLNKIQGIQQPQFNTNLPPPQQLALQQYMSPILAQANQVNTDPEDRANQMAALQKLQSVSNGASNAELNAANYKAMQNAAQQQASANGAIQNKLAAQGTLGSGQELALKMQAAQNAANNSQGGMLQAAQNAALQRLQAQNSYLQGMGSLRNQDYEQSAKNADILNQFNLANTGLRNQMNQMNTNLTNQQSLYNTGQNNAYAQALVNLQNNTAQQKYQDALGQAQAAAGEANTISGNAMNAGATGLGLQANTAAGIAQGVGNAANSLSGMFGKQNGQDEGGDVEQAPKAQNDEEGTNFDGSGYY